MFTVLIRHFGTENLDWFCAAETILNTLFNIKTRNSPEYAKFFIQKLTNRLYCADILEDQKEDDLEILEDYQNMSQNPHGIQNLELRPEVNDYHFAQIFFVVGHVAIKMLTFIEQIDNQLKKSGTENFNQIG